MENLNETTPATSENSSNEQKTFNVTDKILREKKENSAVTKNHSIKEQQYSSVTAKILAGKLIDQTEKKRFLMTIPIVKRAIFKNKVGERRINFMTLTELKKEVEDFLENFGKVTHKVTEKDVLLELPPSDKAISSVPSVLSKEELTALNNIMAENTKETAKNFTEKVESVDNVVDRQYNLRRGMLDFIHKNTNIEYSRNEGGKVECTPSIHNNASLGKVTMSVNKHADALLLIAEMYAILVKGTKLLQEAKRKYIAYRYGLLHGMYNPALLFKSSVDAPEVVLKLLTVVNKYGIRCCLNRALEQDNNFVLFTSENAASYFSKEQKWLLSEFFKSKSHSEQAKVLGLSMDSTRALSLDRGWHSSMEKLNDNKSIISYNEMVQLYEFNITESIFAFKDMYALKRKVNALLNYVMSGRQEGNSFIEDRFKYCIHPEILKVIMATKPYHNAVYKETVPAENREEYAEPDKMFSKINGAVNMAELRAVAKDAYASLPKGEDAVYNRMFDPYLQKTLADKDKIPRLMFPNTECVKQLKKLAPEGYFNPSIVINEETSEEYNPFAEYLKYVAGTPREDIANGLMAYPFKIWDEYLTLLRKHRGPLYRSKLDEEERKELSLIDAVKLEELSVHEEAVTHLFRGAVEYSIKTEIYTAKGTNALLQQIPSEHNENMYKTARLIVAMAWYEKTLGRRTSYYTKAAKKIGKIKLRDTAAAHNIKNNNIMSFSKSTNIRNIQGMFNIYWDVMATRWESKFPYMFYGVKAEALSIIGNHHDFAENALPSNVLSGWAYTTEDMSYDSYECHAISKNHNRIKGTSIITDCLDDLKLVGSYLTNDAWRNWSFPLNTPAYARWFQRYIRSEFARVNKITGNSEIVKEQSNVRVSMYADAPKSDNSKDVPYDDKRYTYYMTHPKLLNGEALLTSSTRTKMASSKITEAIMKAKSARQRLRLLTARKDELLEQKDQLVNSASVDTYSDIVKELEIVEADLKGCIDEIHSKAKRTTTEYKQAIQRKIVDYRKVTSEIIL